MKGQTSPLVAPGRPRKMATMRMGYRWPNPKAAGESSIRIGRVKVVIRVNRVGDPKQTVLHHRFSRGEGNDLFRRRTGRCFANSKVLENFANNRLVLNERYNFHGAPALGTHQWGNGSLISWSETSAFWTLNLVLDNGNGKGIPITGFGKTENTEDSSPSGRQEPWPNQGWREGDPALTFGLR
jgi:hypothetical protein